jgi:hypothetical protein
MDGNKFKTIAKIITFNHGVKTMNIGNLELFLEELEHQ